MSSRARLVLAGIGTLVLLAAIAVVVVLLTRGGSDAAVQPPITVPPAVKSLPAPPARSVVVAREDVGDVPALAVRPRTDGVGLQISDVTQNGIGANGLRVSFAVTTKSGTVRRDA